MKTSIKGLENGIRSLNNSIIILTIISAIAYVLSFPIPSFHFLFIFIAAMTCLFLIEYVNLMLFLGMFRKLKIDDVGVSGDGGSVEHFIDWIVPKKEKDSDKEQENAGDEEK